MLFGVENANAIPAVRNALVPLGIPASAYAIEVMPPIHFMTTLREQLRPTQGGFQIHFGRGGSTRGAGFVCTLGFNADDGTARSFITASHCTNTQGGVEGTQYYQPSRFADPTVIATEVEDPQYFTGQGCPAHRKCRHSDAARALYSSDVASTRGVIAKTAAPNDGSIEVTGTFAITAQDNTTSEFADGTTVNKVGRRTGWTRGDVTNSCADVNVFASRITLLCQTIVEDPDGATIVGGGDSGSGVFRVTGGSHAELLGILWGGSRDNKSFVFSPLKNIRDELGAITATQ